MTERKTFRIDEEMQKEFDKVLVSFNKDGLDLDESKLIRFLINKGLEKLRLEGRIKD